MGNRIAPPEWSLHFIQIRVVCGSLLRAQVVHQSGFFLRLQDETQATFHGGRKPYSKDHWCPDLGPIPCSGAGPISCFSCFCF